MRDHLGITVSGRVQGVLFRDSARRRARKLALTGFVRNEPDGSVYIEAEGEKEKLNEFLKWCRKGPLFASVKEVHSESKGDLKHFDDFVIEYSRE